LPFVLFYGPGYAGPIPVRPALQADYYGIKAFGLIGGLMGFGWTLAGVAGPLFAGWVCDTSGSYRWAFIIFSISTALSIPVILAVKPPQRRPRILVPGVLGVK
jgi:OFA family oxalate/formate antiporter-like MFS transporter